MENQQRGFLEVKKVSQREGSDQMCQMPGQIRRGLQTYYRIPPCRGMCVLHEQRCSSGKGNACLEGTHEEGKGRLWKQLFRRV